MVISYDEKRIVWRKEEDKCLFHCSECDSIWEGTSTDKKKIMHAGICPHCFCEVRMSKEDNQIKRKAYLDDRKANGYVAYYKIYADRTEILNTDHCYKKENGKQYRKDYHLNYCMGSWTFNVYPDYQSTNEWKRTYSKNWLNAFYEDSQYANIISKKEYYECDIPLDLKSNQRYIVMHELMNHKQIWAMRIFNLNSINEVWRNNAWIKSNIGYSKPNCDIEFNVHDLDYMKKYAIRFGDYIDYRLACKECGIVNKHPKDFKEAEAKINEVKDALEVEKKQMKLGPKLLARYESLNNYKSKELEIHPYKTANELFADATEFHCCIYRMYTDRYAEGKTDLYRCLKDGKLLACIEIKNGKIIQIRGKFNADVKEERKIRKLLWKATNQGLMSTTMMTN